MTTIKNLYTANEVATILGVSVSTVRGWVLKKKIDYFKIGGSIRFNDEQIKSFIKCYK